MGDETLFGREGVALVAVGLMHLPVVRYDPRALEVAVLKADPAAQRQQGALLEPIVFDERAAGTGNGRRNHILPLHRFGEAAHGYDFDAEFGAHLLGKGRALFRYDVVYRNARERGEFGSDGAGAEFADGPGGDDAEPLAVLAGQIAGGQTDDCAGAHPAQQVGLHDGQRAGCLGFIEDHEQDGARQAVL